MSALKKNGVQRWKPSYLRNQGKLTPRQKRALRDLWPSYGLTFSYGEFLSLEQSFGRSAPCTLEIGFGMGENLLALAQAQPQLNFLGIEVHRPAIGHVLGELHRLGLNNVRLVRGDALLVLLDYLKNPTFHRILIYFPDPWADPKDEDRRLLQPMLLQGLAPLVHIGCRLELVTDVAVYGEHVQRVMAGFPDWVAQSCSPRPLRTAYECRAIDEGRDIVEHCFAYHPKTQL